MKIIYTKGFPFKGYSAINLFGVVFARKEFNPLSNKSVNHEAIHTQQMKELLYIFFYLWYGVEWIVRLSQYQNTKLAYYNISFEREAYANDRDTNYLSTRRRYNWYKYLQE